MELYHWKQKLIQLFSNTPFRSLDRAYEASKHLQLHSMYFPRLKAFFPSTGNSPWFQKPFETAVSSQFRYVVCYSLLEHRFSLFLLGIHKYLRIPFCSSLPIKQSRSHSDSQSRGYPVEDWLDTKLLATSIPKKISLDYCPNSYMVFKSGNDGKRVKGFSIYRFKNNSASGSVNGSNYAKFKNLNRMNRKLAWIEATSREFDSWRKSRSKQIFPSRTDKTLVEESSNYELAFSSRRPVAYEPIGLVPRSVTRTVSRFKEELSNQSDLLVQNDFDLSRNQAIVSLQYVGFLSLLLPFRLAIGNWFLKPQIKTWWDVRQIQVFLNPLQEEKALRQLREAEALLWLDNVIGNLADTQLQNLDENVHSETIRLAMTYDEPNIQLLVQLATDTISIVIPIISLLLGRKRLAVSNSRIRESFYSLNDTMKSFSILLLTDLCVGFHSPHGWEILSESLLGHFGLIPNRYVIPCFVSTFPVILDTLFKYWIFRHLNRISPSIVATYHTMSE
uniref:Potassium/proton antiporter CemA n=1 Tax=Antrophyum semicostatum TaxID=1604141 RepID=A0A3G5CTQ3_9MONI|nr:chloroplast envelope membrane protein [Antrophyum semicostatum]AYW16259.1 chloroplast envelope membrane protein [Antrophyum semicostatum]